MPGGFPAFGLWSTSIITSVLRNLCTGILQFTQARSNTFVDKVISVHNKTKETKPHGRYKCNRTFIFLVPVHRIFSLKALSGIDLFSFTIVSAQTIIIQSLARVKCNDEFQSFANGRLEVTSVIALRIYLI